MRRKLAGTGLDEMAGPAEQHGTAASWSVRRRSLGMKDDPEFAQAVKAATSWPDVDIECDNARGLAGGNSWNGARPARPPFRKDGPVGSGVEMPVLGERKFSVSAGGAWWS